MKVTAVLFACVILLALFLLAENNRLDAKSSGVNFNKRLYEEDNSIADALRFKTVSAKQFTKKNGYNQQVCFLIDMKIRSGSNRFFVYDLKNNSVLKSGVVTHGRCNERWLVGRKYGNEPGCGCTSLGKYKIGHAYMGRFGLAYKLHGLDSTNNNAFKRFVVLHAHDCVPENEVWSDICQSDGCPTVSPAFLQELKAIINESKKPILLWIYESK